MEFSLTDEQQQLRNTVRKFAESEIAPHVMEWDEASTFPSELIPKLADLGLLGAIFPEQYGGAGMGYQEYAIIIEELSRVDGSIGIIVAAHNSLCTNHIYKFGSEEQKKKFVVPLAHGEKLGCWSLTEPEAGSDAGGTRTTAKQVGGAILLGKDDAEKAEFSQLGNDFGGERGGFVPFHYVRDDFTFSKPADGVAKLLLLVGQGEFHKASREKRALLESVRWAPATSLSG